MAESYTHIASNLQKEEVPTWSLPGPFWDTLLSQVSESFVQIVLNLVLESLDLQMTLDHETTLSQACTAVRVFTSHGSIGNS